jgi:hypothetical protein
MTARNDRPLFREQLLDPLEDLQAVPLLVEQLGSDPQHPLAGRRATLPAVMRSAARAVLLSVVAGLTGGCQNDYPLEPTACDDWCYATERGDCAPQDPASPSVTRSGCPGSDSESAVASHLAWH